MPTVASTDPVTVLMVEEIPIAVTDHVLILNVSDPALPLAIGRQAAETVVYDANLSVLERVRQQVAARHVPNVSVRDDVFPVSEATFDVALLTVPKGRDYARGLIMAARRVLKPGGKLYIGGPTDGGAKTLITDAAVLFGTSSTLTYRRRQRIGVAVQPQTPALYPADWGADPTQMQTRTIAGLQIATMPGIFSWDHLDDGTAFLLEHMPVEEGDQVLDVGCGYGVIGLTAAMRGATHVMLTDDNLLAIRCARASVEANSLKNVEIVAGDMMSGVPGKQFNLIVSNPPFHQQFDVNTNVAHRLIREASAALRPGGRLVIVANAFLKYDQAMEENLIRVRTLAENGRYVVLEGRRAEGKQASKPALVSAPLRRPRPHRQRGNLEQDDTESA